MEKREIIDNKNRFSNLRRKAERLLASRREVDADRDRDEITLLLDELELYELELQMQNEELRSSYGRLDTERTKFTTFFDAAPVGYLILDKAGTIQEINQKALVLFDSKIASELLGRNFAGLLSEKSQNDYYELLYSLDVPNSSGRREVNLRSSNDRHTVQLDATLVENSSTQIPSFYITLTDITNLKNVQSEYQRTTEQLNQALIVSEAGTWTYNLDTKTFTLDAFSKQILDLECGQKDVDYEELIQLFATDDAIKFKDLLSPSGIGFLVDQELHVLAKNGVVRTILVKGKEVNVNQNTKLLAGILVDITTRKNHAVQEELLLKKQDALVRKAVIEAQEKERKQISEILHEGVCQTLYGIRLNLNHFQRDHQKNAGELENVQELINKTILELRNLSIELHPSVLRDFGLSAGINNLCHRMESVDFKVHVSIHKKADLLPREIQLYLFRIAQELISNSVKHAGVNAATLSIDLTDTHVNLQLTDHGNGIQGDLETASQQGSGLRGISNRVSLLGGTFVLSQEKGTAFHIQIPYLTNVK
ncbi:PAS domain S-box protein [Sphingobacterium sp. LRF_L2]|uniref:sensor histidine kinase n=1 Tax=Sphingobacterium sp. LRF_L2 TaxID=3369421 RepID=UPI003F5F44CF